MLWNGIVINASEFREHELAEWEITVVRPPTTADIITVREETRKAIYDVNARIEDAPRVFNCLTFLTWIYKRLGLAVAPLLELVTCGEEVSMGESAPGDIIFVHGRTTWYVDPLYGPIGHVGIITAEGVLHATRRRNGKEVDGVIEETLEEFLKAHGPLRTIKRLVAYPPHMTIARRTWEAWGNGSYVPTTAQGVRNYIAKIAAYRAAINRGEDYLED